MLSKVKRVHFVGIGGIGMSSLAFILLRRGVAVSGSDLKPTRLTDEIKKRGGEIFFGHDAGHIRDDIELVVYSSSIEKSNPELAAARNRGIAILHRSDVVAQLVNPKIGVAVTGAHGKTTTTALSALLLVEAGLDPTVIVGGEVEGLGGNWRNGNGAFAVCEADESDGTFLKLTPDYAILTNIDAEHLDYYRDLEGVIKASGIFIENIKEKGCLIASHGDIHIRDLLGAYKKRFLTYGISAPGPDLRAEAIKMDKFHTSFNAVFKGKTLGAFELNIPGRHNVENGLAVILLGLELGIDIGAIKETLSRYKGAVRRFQVKGDIDGIMVIEDYAHHPAEIMATISACRNWQGRRLVGVFQPHRYTRTKFLKNAFGKSFLELDELILTDVYAASEEPIEGVTTKIIYDEAVKNGQRNIQLMKKEKITPYLLDTVRDQDIVLILGAGDIGEISDELVKGLKDKRQAALERAAF